MMRFISFVVLAISIANANAASINEDDSDPGEPLFLTEYIENGDIETAQELAYVDHPDIDIPSYAGYLTVNKEYNSNLFFWFFPSAYDAENAPIILWLQGGPGTSSLLGMITESGPFNVDAEQNLFPREYSWNLNYSVIYMDNPVGAGFSFTDADEGFARNARDVGENLLLAMQQFFRLFPDLKKNDFYVCGQSYAGKYVPATGYVIYQDSLRETEEIDRPKINMKGLTIGNGLVDPINQLDYADFLYQLGFIDWHGYQQFVDYQKRGAECIEKGDYNCAFYTLDRMMNKHKFPEGSLMSNLTGYRNFFNLLKTKNIDRTPMNDFVTKPVTRRAIHVGNNPYHDLDDENLVEDHMILDIRRSVADYLTELLSHYPVLIYNGQLDLLFSYVLTENYLRKLPFSGADEYKTAKRHIWRLDGDVAGYAKHAGYLTEVLVRNVGHKGAGDDPKPILDMLLRFTTNKGFYDNEQVP